MTIIFAEICTVKIITRPAQGSRRLAEGGRRPGGFWGSDGAISCGGPDILGGPRLGIGGLVSLVSIGGPVSVLVVCCNDKYVINKQRCPYSCEYSPTEWAPQLRWVRMLSFDTEASLGLRAL